MLHVVNFNKQVKLKQLKNQQKASELEKVGLRSPSVILAQTVQRKTDSGYWLNNHPVTSPAKLSHESSENEHYPKHAAAGGGRSKIQAPAATILNHSHSEQPKKGGVTKHF